MKTCLQLIGSRILYLKDETDETTVNFLEDEIGDIVLEQQCIFIYKGLEVYVIAYYPWLLQLEQ